MSLVDDATLVFPTGIREVFPHRSLEEPFAAFTTVDTVVLPRGAVPTDAAEVLGSTQRMIGRELTVGGGDTVPI
jgi:hypothetical protein